MFPYLGLLLSPEFEAHPASYLIRGGFPIPATQNINNYFNADFNLSALRLSASIS